MTKVNLFRLSGEPNKNLENEIQKIMEELNDFFGINWVHNVPKVVLLDSRELINKVMGKETPDWWIGHWDGHSTVYLLDRDKFETESNHKKIGVAEYRALIKHELCHAFQTARGFYWKPVWLREGLCQYVAGQLEFMHERKAFGYFLNSFDKAEDKVYLEAGSVVRLLIEKFGKEKLMELFKQAKEQKPDEEGFKKIFEKLYGIELSYESINTLSGPIDVSNLPYRKNIGCVVFKGDKFLLLHKPDWPENHWKFPQGGIDENESDEDTAKRELLEELGTDKFKITGKSKNVRQYDWSDDAVEKAGYRWKGQNQKFFLVEFLGKDSDIKPDPKEIEKFKWVTKKELLSIINIDHKNFTGYRDAIERILEEFESTFPFKI